MRGLCPCRFPGRHQCLADQCICICHSRFWQHAASLHCLAHRLIGASHIEWHFGIGLGAHSWVGHARHRSGLFDCLQRQCHLFFLYLRSARSSLQLKFDSPLSKPLFLDILKVGAMSSLSPLQTVASIVILTRLVSNFGPEALAGYGIGSRLEFCWCP